MTNRVIPAATAGRSLVRDQATTARAADRVILMGGDERPDLRQLPFELDLHRAGVLLSIGQVGLAARTLRWEVVTDGIDMTGIGGGPLVARMSALPTRLPTAGDTGRARWRGWRVRP
jgi:hypothetical protein